MATRKKYRNYIQTEAVPFLYISEKKRSKIRLFYRLTYLPFHLKIILIMTQKIDN